MWDVEGVRECGVRVCGCVRVWVGGRVRAVRQEREGPNPNPNPKPNPNPNPNPSPNPNSNPSPTPHPKQVRLPEQQQQLRAACNGYKERLATSEARLGTVLCPAAGRTLTLTPQPQP